MCFYLYYRADSYFIYSWTMQVLLMQTRSSFFIHYMNNSYCCLEVRRTFTVDLRLLQTVNPFLLSLFIFWKGFIGVTAAQMIVAQRSDLKTHPDVLMSHRENVQTRSPSFLLLCLLKHNFKWKKLKKFCCRSFSEPLLLVLPQHEHFSVFSVSTKLLYREMKDNVTEMFCFWAQDLLKYFLLCKETKNVPVKFPPSVKQRRYSGN